MLWHFFVFFPRIILGTLLIETFISLSQFYQHVSKSLDWNQCGCQMWQQFPHLHKLQKVQVSVMLLLKFTRGALGLVLLSCQRQISSSLRLQDLRLWFGGSNPDSRPNLFTATLLHFSLQPSCYPEREHDVLFGFYNTEGGFYFFHFSGYFSCPQNCMQSVSLMLKPSALEPFFHSHRLLISVLYFCQGQLSEAEEIATVLWANLIANLVRTTADLICGWCPLSWFSEDNLFNFLSCSRV